MNPSATHLVMFDIDGTLVESYDFDTQCFKQAAEEVLGTSIDTEWHTYPHVTDSGITRALLARHAPSSEKQVAISAAIKDRFLTLITQYISRHGVKPIPGAREFLQRLNQTANVKLALATGGWAESARMKLEAAGLEVAEIPLASASDHYDRIEIMKLAEQKATGTTGANHQTRTYFGDGVWDQSASRQLGYGFVLIGNRLRHQPCLPDYRDLNASLQCLPFQ